MPGAFSLLTPQAFAAVRAPQDIVTILRLSQAGADKKRLKEDA